MNNMVMQNQIIRISREKADNLAMELFIKTTGLNAAGDKCARMLSQGICLRESIQDRINIRAVVSSFPGTAMNGNVAVLGEIKFECNAFESFNPNSVIGIYAFILTAGDFDDNDHSSSLDQLYTDIWGTSYVEAGLRVLKQHIKRHINQNIQNTIEDGQSSDTNITILDRFGPGYYGMDINQLKQFFKLLDSDSIGVKLVNNSLMIPIKSCTGFFIAVNDGTILPKSDCNSCRAEYRNCSFCHSSLK